MMKLKWVAMLCSLMIALSITACSVSPKSAEAPGGKDESIAEQQTRTDQEQSQEQEQQAPSDTAPLTGLPVEQPATSRPMAVMINNMEKARPQAGLSHADIVYEVLAEGGITRLVAIFQSEVFTEPIGPIRSIRPYLIDLGDSFQAVLAHAGASNDGYAILQRQHKPYLDEISNAGPYFWRDNSRKAPHNLYSSLDKLREGALKKKYEQEVQVATYPFAKEGDQVAGNSVSQIDIRFQLKSYQVTYTYQASTKQYLRSINGKPHVDANNNEQLQATNVAVLGADHRTLDNEGRLAVDLDKGGEARLYQRGQEISCTWQRSRKDDVIRLYKDGQELSLFPGKTYYNIVPNTPDFASHITLVS